MRIGTLILLLFSYLIVHSQDDYHKGLQEEFTTQFNLPSGEWVFFDTEAKILSEAGGYGGTFSTVASTETSFQQKLKINISSKGNNPWDAGWRIPNQQVIQNGDKLLIVLNIRSLSEDGEVLFFAENSSSFSKEIYLPIQVTPQWRRYLIAIEASDSYAARRLNIGFHLATQRQELEVGGFTAINFKKQISLSDLPSDLGNDQYEGYEEDAAWRVEAADRIEELRKADLKIQVVDTEGNPVKNFPVEVNMKKHHFSFGTAVTAQRLAGNNDHNRIYEDRFLNFGGQGKGFNAAVFENDMKWPAFENNWLVTKPELVKAVQWLYDNDIYLRGHTLIWPGASNMPSDMAANANNEGYLVDRVNEHIKEILNYSGIKGMVQEWDVLNEITTNRSLESYLKGYQNYTSGREIYPEIFTKTHQEDSTIGLWLNDYVTMSVGNEPGDSQYELYKSFVKEIVDSGAPIDGIGFQGHIGALPNGISSVLAILDDFYGAFGLKAKITEFDLPSQVSEELAAKYLVDFVTAIFSHPSVDGFLFWSFWDGATYMNPGANLFRQDWTRTPACEAFSDLLFNQWWTEEEVITNDGGVSSLRGFKGKYEITYTCNNEKIIKSIELTENTEVAITCNQITTSTDEATSNLEMSIFPNPSRGSFIVELPDPVDGTGSLFSMDGKRIASFKLFSGKAMLELDLPPNNYLLKVQSDSKIYAQKVVIKK